MTPAEYAAAVGSEVRAELARQRRTQADLAGALEITPATAAKRLDGSSPFDLVELAKTANWLDVPIRRLQPTKSSVPPPSPEPGRGGAPRTAAAPVGGAR